jgi:hypothetical protein
VGKLIEERDYIDALRQYAKARIGFVGATGADYVGYAANDEVDRHAPRMVETQELSGIKAQHIFS